MTKEKVAWVSWVAEQDATGELAEAYKAVTMSDGQVENLYKAMSLTPRVIKPADEHYLALLHDPASPLKPWLAELVATYVSILCGSQYAALNHGENFEHYFGDRDVSGRILNGLRLGHYEYALTEDARASLTFTKKLSLTPGEMSQQDINALRHAGLCDISISYIAQIAASFAYWARITNALGIQPGEQIGLSGRPLSQE
ncbi:peroxidase-related enzyme [Phaeobacter sp. C3_T13_0]|uniref:peroxidase-related enzyme n=1 Tax=Phaeobacter cretensis TaxID=3342641 RepID=UPI0039BC5031